MAGRESDIQSSIIKQLTKAGWLVVKLIVTNLNGIPDLMAIKKGRIVFIEVKQPGKPLAHLQQHRILQLQREGIEAFRADCLRDVEHLLT